MKKFVFVRRSKNETSHRVVPLNASAVEAITRTAERADLLGHSEPDHFLWPACQWGRYDPTQPMLKWGTARCAMRPPATVPVPRLAAHGDYETRRVGRRRSCAGVDQRPSVAADTGAHSHIRIDTKRQALDALDNARPNGEKNSTGSGSDDGDDETNGRDTDSKATRTPNSDAGIPLIPRLAESLTSLTSQFAFGGISALR